MAKSVLICFFVSEAESQASQASLLSDRDVVNKIKCLIDIERKLRQELGEHEKKVIEEWGLSLLNKGRELGLDFMGGK